MDKMKFAVLFAAVLAPAVAWANSVIVEGTTYTCTNTCDVTFSNGTTQCETAVEVAFDS
jgi:hypothetical protein